MTNFDFGKFIEKYESRICRKAILITRDESGARASFEDGLIWGYNNFNGKGSLEGWMRYCGSSYVKNFVKKYYTNKQNLDVAELTDILTDTKASDENIENDYEIRNRIKYINGHLTEHQQKIFNALLEGYSLSDIARELGTTPQAIYKTRKRLQKVYVELFGEVIR